MAQLWTNNAATTLAAAVTTNSQTSLTLASGKGALFPNPSSPDYFLVTLDDGTNVEIVKCTARSTDTLTVVRAQEGTTAQSSFAIGTKAELRLTAGSVWPSAMNRETVADASYTIAGTADRYIGLTSITAARTITLPAASGRQGQMIILNDESGSITPTLKWTPTRAGSDTFGPGSGITSFDLVTGGSEAMLVSDGVSKWNLVRLSRQKQTYTSGATAWVAPPGVYSALVTAVGGGGGGGHAGRFPPRGPRPAAVGGGRGHPPRPPRLAWRRGGGDCNRHSWRSTRYKLYRNSRGWREWSNYQWSLWIQWIQYHLRFAVNRRRRLWWRQYGSRQRSPFHSWRFQLGSSSSS